MALVACPECSHNVSDRAATCPQCGFPTGTLKSIVISPKSIATSNTKGSQCPKCDSEDTQTIRMLVSQGTHGGQVNMVGINTEGTIGIGMGAVGMQNSLARKLDSGPKPTSAFGDYLVVFAIFWCLFFGGVLYTVYTSDEGGGMKEGEEGALIIAGFVVAFGLIVGCVGIYLAATTSGRVEVWKKKKMLQESGWICRRCGAIWVP
jgi:hypothetical protein